MFISKTNNYIGLRSLIPRYEQNCGCNTKTLVRWFKISSELRIYLAYLSFSLLAVKNKFNSIIPSQWEVAVFSEECENKLMRA
ncbi:MAG: hypothetical protein KME50_18400 [Nostoc desertorum CM1-VF14]|nr:hypothetical protein [Nostoc desertorum CM1-VF14]